MACRATEAPNRYRIVLLADADVLDGVAAAGTESLKPRGPRPRGGFPEYSSPSGVIGDASRDTRVYIASGGPAAKGQTDLERCSLLIRITSKIQARTT
jgi:hypothetical protein